MKDKNLAGILALVFGWMGVHRFYLGQNGRGTFLAIFAFFAWTSGSIGLLTIPWIISLIDAIILFSMGKDEFDIKYNKSYFKAVKRKQKEKDKKQPRTDYQSRPKKETPPQRTRRSSHQAAAKYNPLKESGIKKFRDFDYQGAIKDFEKALVGLPNDVALHFNLACAYSLNENPEKGFYHLDKAVSNGFDDFEKIKTHDALAFLRIQPSFTDFEKNGFQLAILESESQVDDSLESDQPKANDPEELINTKSDELLEQLKKLADLREKGLLTKEEFELEKQKILRRSRDL